MRKSTISTAVSAPTYLGARGAPCCRPRVRLCRVRKRDPSPTRLHARALQGQQQAEQALAGSAQRQVGQAQREGGQRQHGAAQRPDPQRRKAHDQKAQRVLLEPLQRRQAGEREEQVEAGGLAHQEAHGGVAAAADTDRGSVELGGRLGTGQQSGTG
jgi:hypothetical protein